MEAEAQLSWDVSDVSPPLALHKSAGRVSGPLGQGLGRVGKVEWDPFA